MAKCEYCNKNMLRAKGCIRVPVVHNGKEYEPVKVGDEGSWLADDVNNRCPDCNAAYGHYHHPGCDNERCPICGGQLISCDCMDQDETKYDKFTSVLSEIFEEVKKNYSSNDEDNEKNYICSVFLVGFEYEKTKKAIKDSGFVADIATVASAPYFCISYLNGTNINCTKKQAKIIAEHLKKKGYDARVSFFCK